MFILYISDISDMDNYFHFYFSFAKEFGHPDWEGYGSFIHSGPRDMALSTRQSVVARSQPPPMINWKHGKKQFLSLPFRGTHLTTFTMGMKLPCFTSHCLIGPTALMVTSLQVLQNVKTD